MTGRSGDPSGRPKKRREDGVAMVEFALVLPVFLALVFGVISYGYMLSYRQSISQAAAEGARAMAVSPAAMSTASKNARATLAINNAMGGYGVTCSGGQLLKGGSVVGTCAAPVVAPCAGDASRQCATVTVTHRYRDNPLIPSFPGLGITLPERLTYTSVVEVSS